MRRTHRGGGRLLSFIINFLINAELTIPAWILLALHFVFGISLWWFIGVLALYTVWIILLTFVINWAASGAEPDAPRENKNPYSKKTQDYNMNKD